MSLVQAGGQVPQGQIFSLEAGEGYSGEVIAGDLVEHSDPPVQPVEVARVRWAEADGRAMLAFDEDRAYLSYGQGEEDELQMVRNFTVSARVYPQPDRNFSGESAPLGYFVAKSQGWDNNSNHSWYVTADAKNALRVGLSGNGKEYVVITGGWVPDGEWSDVAFSFEDQGGDLGLVRLYVDGEEVWLRETPFPELFNAVASDFRIGNSHNGNNPFRGGIASVRLFDRVLTGEEIRQLHSKKTK